MGTALDKPVLFELVDDDRHVRTSSVIELRELAVRQWSGPQLEKDLAPPSSKAEAKRFCEIAMTTVLIDELSHERPGQLGRTHWDLYGPRDPAGPGTYHGTVCPR